MTTSSRNSDDATRTKTAVTTMLAPDTVLSGRYRILEIVGAGGMGVVYRARDEELDVDVAVKLLSDERLSDPDALERFRREIRLSRQISHPSVVRIHDIGTDGDVVFLTMDYVPARTLRERLTEGPLDADSATGIAAQVAAALDAAHQEGVIHRDVKPSNILVDDQQRAWLTDFGVARSLNQPGITQVGQVIGTLEYLSPEQIRGDTVDGRADLYALGLVLCEMLTGEVPVTGETSEETVARRLAGTTAIRLPESKGMTRQLRAIIRRCLSSDPDARYPDAGALKADLKRGRLSLHRRRHLGVAGVAGLFAVAGLAVWIGWPERAPVPEPRAPDAAQRIAVFPLVNQTGDASLDWVRRGLAQSIAADLAERPGLQVTDPVRVGRTLADLRLEPAALDERGLQQVARLIGVDRVVSGQLVGAGRELRLELNLTDSTGNRLGRALVPVEPDGILRGAQAAMLELLELLDVRTPAVRQAPPLSSVPDALAGFDAGVAALAAGHRSAAIEELERAVAADDDFGLAWLRLSEAYLEGGFYQEALDASARAVELLRDYGGRAALWAEARRAELEGRVDRALEFFERLVEHYPRDTGARLALGEMLGDMGSLDAASTQLERVARDDPVHPRVWFLLGKFSIIAGDAQTAADDYLVRALVIQNRLGNPEGRAEVINALGIANEHLGELAQAAEYYRESADLYESAGGGRGLAASLSNLSRISLIRGEYDYARGVLEDALEIRRNMGDLPGMADLHTDFGVLEEEAGDYAAALTNYRQALRIIEDTGGGRGLGRAYTNLAFTYMMLGQLDNAEAFIERALDTHRRADNQERLMSSLQIRGELQLSRGNWAAAQASLLESLELARELNNPFGEAPAQGSIGTLAWYQGRIGAALQAFDAAVAILEPLEDHRGLAEYHLRATEMLLDLELTEAAGARLEQARRFAPDRGNLSQRARLARASAMLQAQAGQRESAMKELDRALELAEASSSMIVRLEIELTRLHWLGGDVGQARELVDTAGEIGHRPLRLYSLERLTERLMDAGNFDAAQTTARTGLRPPLALEPWVGNWRLNRLLAVSETAAGGDGEGEADMARSRRQFEALADSLPEELRARFQARHADSLGLALVP